MQKKKILIFILIILFAFYYFRYDQGPVQTSGNTKFYLVKDRWLNQNYLKVYGTYEEKIYAGDLIPQINQDKINNRKYVLLKEFPYKEELARAIAIREDARSKRAIYKDGHTKYQNLWLEENSYVPPWDRQQKQGLTNTDANTKIIEEEGLWQEQNKIFTPNDKKIKSLYAKAAIEAKNKISRQANSNRKIVTIIWAVFTVITMGLLLKNYQSTKG